MELLTRYFLNGENGEIQLSENEFRELQCGLVKEQPVILEDAKEDISDDVQAVENMEEEFYSEYDENLDLSRSEDNIL